MQAVAHLAWERLDICFRQKPYIMVVNFLDRYRFQGCSHVSACKPPCKRLRTSIEPASDAQKHPSAACQGSNDHIIA